MLGEHRLPSQNRAADRALTVTEPNVLGVRAELRMTRRRSVSSDLLREDWIGSGDEEQNLEYRVRRTVGGF